MASLWVTASAEGSYLRVDENQSTRIDSSQTAYGISVPWNGRLRVTTGQWNEVDSRCTLKIKNRESFQVTVVVIEDVSSLLPPRSPERRFITEAYTQSSRVSFINLKSDQEGMVELYGSRELRVIDET